MEDCLQSLKVDDGQKSILFEHPEADRALQFLERSELNFKYCRLCDNTVEDGHFQTKSHIKRREELGIKELEDFSFSCLLFNSVPGDITEELLKEKEKALKRKVKRIK